MPRATYPSLLDIACGPARHEVILSEKGYRVVGIDNNHAAIQAAEALDIADAKFRVLDMREIAELQQVFDGAINLWHSFGYYDDATNRTILRSIVASLRKGGRAVFDIYNRDYMRNVHHHEQNERNGELINTYRTWSGNRMKCQINYQNRPPDVLEWQLFDPEEFAECATQCGFSEVLRCAWFDESIPPSPEHARMQFVLERS